MAWSLEPCEYRNLNPSAGKISASMDRQRHGFDRQTQRWNGRQPDRAHVFHPALPDSGRGRNRTGDTRIFSPLLYQLSYPSRVFFPFRRPNQQVCQRTGLPSGRKALPGALHSPPSSPPFPARRQNQLNRRQEAKGGPSDHLKGTAAEYPARLLLVERKGQSHERHDDDRCHSRHCDASPEQPPPSGGRGQWFALGLQLAGPVGLFTLR